MRRADMVFMASREYDIYKVRERLAARQESVGRAGHGEAKFGGPDGAYLVDGGSHGELFECHHADTLYARFPLCLSDVAGSC